MKESREKRTVLVVGGGAAGLLAAGTAARDGARVTLLEKNPRLGRKLLITGKGRCNITNSRDIKEFIGNYPSNGAFLYSALNTFSNQDLIELLGKMGLEVKEERGGRIFPASDRSSDVLQALERYTKKPAVDIRLGEPVRKLLVDREEKRVTGVLTSVAEYTSDAVIIATGGASYPLTGSTGDGYQWAKDLGHAVVPLRPSLVPLETRERWVPDLQGLTLKNVQVQAYAGEELLGQEFGEMLFTHFGVSGPIILSLSGYIGQVWRKRSRVVRLSINLKPALSPQQLDQRIQRDLTAAGKKQFKNSLGGLLPRAMIPVVVELSGIVGEKPANQVTREERQRLGGLLQDLSVTTERSRPIAEAIVTAGGVAVKEIDPRTMASKLWKGLYFAGEVIDVDGYTGGYNLQAAFSTGFLAGKAAAKKE
ncbi:MAG: NAD(P)/FAD-dependent oxidoreductase [Firmicutes bacterium]|nr:NAD(P)/FAD-dependent oxidoreductase [Bacillota bacterium]